MRTTCRESSVGASPSWVWGEPGRQASRSCSNPTLSSRPAWPRMSTRTPPLSERSPRSSGAGGARGLRRRGAGSLPRLGSHPRAIGAGADARRGTARVRRLEPRRCLRRAEPPPAHRAPRASAARDAPPCRPDRLAAEVEDAPLDRSDLLDEEPLRSDARDLLWLAQERASSGRDPRVDPRHQPGGGPAPRDCRRDHRHGGRRANHGLSAGRRRAGHGHESAGSGRDLRPADGDRSWRESPTWRPRRAGSGRSPSGTSVNAARRSRPWRSGSRCSTTPASPSSVADRTSHLETEGVTTDEPNADERP